MNQFGNNVDGDNKVPTSPHRVSKRAVTIAIVIFALIVVGMFTFAYLKKGELEDVNPQQKEDQAVLAEVKYAAITRVDAKHYLIDGVHTLVGEILMPTPCDLLESSVSVAESFPEQVMIDFSVINNAEFCAQVITPQRFKVTATVSPDATFSARFMGRSIDLNLIPAAAGEMPEDFELFIKG